MTAQQFPTSAAQRSQWLLHELDPSSCQYNVTWAINVRRELSAAQMRVAIDTVVARHGALRTCFAAVEGKPVQLVAEWLNVELSVVDLTEKADADRPAQVDRLRRRLATTPFDLARGPLLRAQLVHLAMEDHQILLSVHHAVADARSIGILTSEVATVLNGGTLTDPVPQYAAYVVAHQAELPTDMADRMLTFWRRQLSDAPWTIALPPGRRRAVTSTDLGGRYPLSVDSALLHQLTALARKHRTTVFGVLLAAVGVLMSRHSGQETVLIGTPISDRDRRGLDGMVGPLMNVLPLRVDIAASLDVAALLAKLRQTTIEALTHRWMPFDQLVVELNPHRETDKNPLVQVMLAYHENDSDPLPPWVSVLETVTGSAKFDLVFTISADQPEGSFLEYRTDVFDDEFVAALAEQLDVLLHSLAAGYTGPVLRLPLLSPQARDQVVELGKADRAIVPANDIAAIVATQARRTPDMVALVAAGVTTTYQELNRKANRLARRLLACGVRPEDAVGLCAGRSPAMVIGLLAILKAGGAVVTLEPHDHPQRHRLLMAEAGVRLTLAEPELLAGFDSSCPVLVLDNLDAVDAADDHDSGTSVQPDQLAYILFTSGSTGRPKGVMVTHRGVLNYVFWCISQFDVTAGAGVPLHGSIGFDTTVMTSLLPALFSGQRVHLFGRQDSPAFALAEMAESGLDFSYVALTPSQFQMIRMADHARRFSPRLLVIGGETLHGWMLPQTVHGTPAHRVINEYGPTETVAASCAYGLPADQPPPVTVPIGLPISNLTALVLDEFGQPVPVGVPGELYIGGAGVARGYLGQPALTAAAFVPAPFGDEPGARVYRTGDRVRWLPCGVLEFLGRFDEQLKIHGVRVEPDEVRAVLARHADVRDAAVSAQSDGTEVELIAYVVPTGPETTVETLHTYLAGRLPHASLPAGYVFLDALPLTPNGKLNRSVLAGQVPVRPGSAQIFVAPAGPTEVRVAQIWAEVLGPRTVGAEDNFFAQGGHSLAGTRLLARIAATFGLQLGLRTLFDAPTVRSLARHIDQAESIQHSYDTIQPRRGLRVGLSANHTQVEGDP